MKGLVFTGNETVELQDFPDPQAAAGEAIIKVRASGVCGSDLPRYRDAEGSKGIITGHEPCGEVAEIGPGVPSGLRVGDRVMVHHYAGCGFCDVCAMGFEQACQNDRVTYGTGAHGGHAEFIKVPARTLVHLPDELSFEAGAAIACGTGTAWNGLKKMNVSGRDTVAVFGQGPVGVSGVVSAKAMGARVIAVDISPERLEFARQLGADFTINSMETDLIEAVQEITSGHGATASLETSGAGPARAQALEVLSYFGRCSFIGNGAPSTIDIRGEVIRKVLTIFGSWTFTKAEQIEIARFMVENKVDLDALVSKRYSLDEAETAYREFAGGATGKPMITFDN
ncbi:zinc-dependent alcohol dehydrogenase family protein [Leucobacter denitrificans]|uniref:Zinc-binding dehydrogenase n=1 Tax=Leucobacter denitrificans TaxID=683042 RepID=A0A7G9S319_9MICO|nr:zinc-binding dehydrogenase [Leucobacter denitrificans]QNN62244.1 zinc-binding dehydrogenase [Leucobacter denitrificans]